MRIELFLPKTVAEKLKDLNADLESEFLEFLLRRLKLNPREEAACHTEVALEFLREGKRLVDTDPVQASEKLYKAVEESVKALALVENLSDVLNRVEARGRWTVTDLDRAARILSKKLGRWVLDAFDKAWFLHVWGFHERKLDSDAVKERIPDIERLVLRACEIAKRAPDSSSQTA